VRILSVENLRFNYFQNRAVSSFESCLCAG